MRTRRDQYEILSDIEEVTAELDRLSLRQRTLVAELRQATPRNEDRARANLALAIFQKGDRVRVIGRSVDSKGVGFGTEATVTWLNNAFVGIRTDSGIKTKRARGNLRHRT